MDMKIDIHGWFVKTIGPKSLESYSEGHCLSGPRDFYKSIKFPICPACNHMNSPIMLIDFSDSRLEDLNLWDELLLCIHCHNGCGLKSKYGWPNYWWDYSFPNEPKILAVEQIVKEEGMPPRDWEFESVEVEIVPRIVKNAYKIETETRIGGEPAWLQNPLQQERVLLCIGCNKPMQMLFQWSETNMEYIPKGLGESNGLIMGNPGMAYWFGCQECKIVGQIIEYD
jgi:hypothetical protein